MTDYTVFLDEASITASRFRSVAALSLPTLHVNRFTADIDSILNDSGISKEFKWHNLNGAKYYFCGEKFVKYVLSNYQQMLLRLDVIIWDTQDFRHHVFKRNDAANLERMLYHLLNKVLSKRGSGCIWSIYPDIKDDFDWQTAFDCLNYSGKNINLTQPLFSIRRQYSIKRLQPSDSILVKPIQVADLFAGMGAYSKNKYPIYRSYVSNLTGSNLQLFDQPIVKIGNIDEVRCRLLYFFWSQSRNLKLGISLNDKQGLWTPAPSNPINFWQYEPQGTYDKAPTFQEI